jgi:hypothetical protein
MRPLVVCTLVVLLLAGASARAEEPIQDNSFLIEEAYNQERGVVQHISAFSRVAGTGDWIYTFTQEWPVPNERHQLGYTLPVADLHSAAAANLGLGDVAINYRYQAVGNGGTPLAFSPRLTVVVPTGQSEKALGAGGAGLQVNLPLSWAASPRIVTHWNAGATHTFAARDAVGHRADTNAYALGQSVIWLTRPKINLLLETAWIRTGVVAGPGVVASTDSVFVSPGVRWAHDLRGGLQIVPGIAFPIGVGPSRGQHALFAYLSFEHPFRSSR